MIFKIKLLIFSFLIIVIPIQIFSSQEESSLLGQHYPMNNKNNTNEDSLNYHSIMALIPKEEHFNVTKNAITDFFESLRNNRKELLQLLENNKEKNTLTVQQFSQFLSAEKNNLSQEDGKILAKNFDKFIDEEQNLFELLCKEHMALVVVLSKFQEILESL